MASASQKTKGSGPKIRLLQIVIALTLGIGPFAFFNRASVIRQVQSFYSGVRERFTAQATVSDAPQEAGTLPGPYPARGQNVLGVRTKYDNLELGVPCRTDSIIDREGYSLGYVERHEQPAYVAYKMTRKEATTKAASRDDNFRPDPKVPTGSATLEDYRGSGYDRGHLAPAADMAFSKKTMSESFYMSNMSPQKPEFNRGVWKDLEAQIRKFAVDEGEIYVVTGPVLPARKTKAIGKSKVTVPSHYYKVVYAPNPPGKMIGFLLPNAGSKKSPKEFAVSVDAVESATGLNFFSLVPQPRQEELESVVSVKDWKWISRDYTVPFGVGGAVLLLLGVIALIRRTRRSPAPKRAAARKSGKKPARSRR